MRDRGDSRKAQYSFVIEPETLSQIAHDAGAESFGVASVDPFEESRSRIIEQKSLGMQARLGFTYANPEKSTNITSTRPWARSLLVFAVPYGAASTPPAPTGALVARFAERNRYAEVMAVGHALEAHLRDSGFRSETLVDDNALVDRSAAMRAGISWLGKSSMALTPLHGPWTLIGTVVTDAEVTPSSPMARTCGTCTACIPACPTEAITALGVDSRRCIAAWLQSPGWLPFWIRPHIGRRIYGCDDCLTSCPPGRKELDVVKSPPRPLPFDRLLSCSDDELVDRFHWWYIPRRDGRYIRRNLLVAAGNSREPEARDAIRQHVRHPSSMIRAHAVWAIARSVGHHALPELESARAAETVPETLDEIDQVIAGLT